MARYRGPKSKISRRVKEAIFGPDKALERRPYGPGQHGNSRRRKKESEYSVQLAEKQKAKYTYGILEKQFSNMFKAANARQGITGEILLQFCESRLDNVVYLSSRTITSAGGGTPPDGLAPSPNTAMSGAGSSSTAEATSHSVAGLPATQ